jgi:hypothetical protein
MATQTLAAADAILKDLYVGPIVEQLNYKTYMLDQIQRDVDSVDHTGRRAIVPVHTGRNRGRGSRGDNSTLPVAGMQTWQDAIIPIRYLYYAMEITDPAIEASKTNEGAFINLLKAETQGVANDMKKDVNRQVYGDGTGLLAGVRANSTTTTVNVDSVQYIKIGDPVDVVLKSTGALGAGPIGVVGDTVTGRSNTAGSETITLATGVAGTVTTSYGVYVAGSYGKEMDGLRNIVSTGRTLHSINSATAGNEFWNASFYQSASSGVAGESLFEQLADSVGETGQGNVEAFITSRGIKRRLADTYQSQKRFNDAQAVNVHGGYTAIMVNEVPVISDDDCPKGNIFGIDKGSLKWFEQTKPGWLEQQNSGIFHLKDAYVASSAGYKQNAWQAWFRWYAALGCTAPNRNGRIYSAEDDVPPMTG